MNYKRKDGTNRSLSKKRNVKGTWAVPKNIRMKIKDSKNDRDIKGL